MNKACKELTDTIEKIKQTADRQSRNETTKEDEKFFNNLDFAISKSIVSDFGKSRSLQIAHHILAHYVGEESG